MGLSSTVVSGINGVCVIDPLGALLQKGPKGSRQESSPTEWPTWLTPQLIFTGLVGLILSLVVYIWNGSVKDMDEFHHELKTVNVSIANLAESVGRIDERTKSLERAIWKVKARSAGFNNPQIVPVALTPNTVFESTTSGKMGEKYSFKYTILSYDAVSHVLRFKFDAELPNKITFENITVVTEPGKMVDLSEMVGTEGLPKIYFQIIDMPARNEAVVAIGSKVKSSGIPPDPPS